MWPATLTTMPVPYSTLRRGGGAEPGAGDFVLRHAPARALLAGLRRRGESRALGRREHAGVLELARLLERLDRRDGAVRELAIDQAVVVAGPGEIELDGDA